MAGWITYLTVFFYNTIKNMVRRFLPALGIPEDIMLAIIGWFLSKKTGWMAEFGEGLLLGAIASIGASGGIALGGLLGGGAQAQATPTAQVVEAVQY
jgi:hypothetical protein